MLGSKVPSCKSYKLKNRDSTLTTLFIYCKPSDSSSIIKIGLINEMNLCYYSKVKLHMEPIICTLCIWVSIKMRLHTNQENNKLWNLFIPAQFIWIFSKTVQRPDDDGSVHINHILSQVMFWCNFLSCWIFSWMKKFLAIFISWYTIEGSCNSHCSLKINIY